MRPTLLSLFAVALLACANTPAGPADDRFELDGPRVRYSYVYADDSTYYAERWDSTTVGTAAVVIADGTIALTGSVIGLVSKCLLQSPALLDPASCQWTQITAGFFSDIQTGGVAEWRGDTLVVSGAGMGPLQSGGGAVWIRAGDRLTFSVDVVNGPRTASLALPFMRK